MVETFLNLGETTADDTRDKFWRDTLAKIHGEIAYGQQDDAEVHVWSLAGLRMSKNTMHRGEAMHHAMRTDRWIVIPCTRTCSTPECSTNEECNVVHPLIILSDCWVTAQNKQVQIRSITEAVKRALFQHNVCARMCEVCRKGEVTTSKNIAQTELPRLLVLAAAAGSNMASMAVPEELEVAEGWTYTAVGMCLFTRGHYTAVVRADNEWCFYNDIGGLFTKNARHVQVTAQYMPRGYERRLLYYVLAKQPVAKVQPVEFEDMCRHGGMDVQSGVVVVVE